MPSCWPIWCAPTGHNHRPIAGDRTEAEATKVLARAHQNLIWTRTRHTNALRSALREYYPAALEAFGIWPTATRWRCWAGHRLPSMAPGWAWRRSARH